MAKAKSASWQESFPSLILGAVVVVILGLLVANFLTRKSPEIGGGEQTFESPAVSQSERQQQYKVVQGDSLSAISQKFYGSVELWPALATINKVANPNVIYKDVTLIVPAKEEAQKTNALLSATAYQVQAGDTLFLISEKVYGNGSRWTVLDRANNVGRLPNGNPLIFAGSTLVVPR